MYEKEDLDAKKRELETAEGVLNRAKQEASLLKGNRDTLEEELSKSIDLLDKSYEKQNDSFKEKIEDLVNTSFEMSMANYLSISEIVQKDIQNLETKLSDILACKEKYKSLKLKIDELEKESNEIIRENSSKKEEYNRLSGEYNASKSAYETEIKELEYEDLNGLNSEIENQKTILSANKEKIADIEKRVENYFVEYNDLKSQKQTLISLVQGQDEDTVRQAYEEYNHEIENLKNRINEVDAEQTEIISILKNISKALVVYEKSLQALEEKKNLFDQYSNLSATCSGELPGKPKIKLETFVQMSFFDRILNRANIRFLKMSEGRYMLNRDDEGDNKRSQTGLDLSVHDLSNNTYRSTKSLSGGESFQASLCLALGFADEIQHSAGGIQIETMFIDEGFGTLDNVALKNAVDSLVDLSKGNKLVGIISHVDELRERIDRGISIEKSSFKGSKVTIQV